MRKFVALICAAIIVAVSCPALAAGKLNILTWAEYIDPEVMRDFQVKYGVKINLDYYETNEQMLEKLQEAGAGRYDIIVPSSYLVPSLRSLGLIQPLNRDLLPDIKNLDSRFTKMETDPGNKWCVPYLWGTTGLAVRTSDIEQVPSSWRLIYDPKAEIGPFTIIDSPRDAIGSALKYLGYSINSTDPKAIEEAVRLINETKKRETFAGFESGLSALNNIMNGAVVAAHSYSSETQRIKRDEADIFYLIPDEGTEIWVDVVAIPAKAPNGDKAHAFINFLLNPEVGARVATYNHSATPNAVSRTYVPSEDLANPAMYPDSAREDLEFIIDLGPENRLYDEAWKQIKGE
ncbi:polyamine ABC transporter substrate-binding protein [Deltaproteobacteria bacterium Smac51]|nr:polyamine ABC transporter substrate-binding protein [Deltaproteobacteria bacterium Smac51]